MLRIIKDVISFLNGFRKWSVTVMMIVIGTTLLVKTYLTGDQYVKLMLGIVTVFLGVNGLEHCMSTVNKWLDLKPKIPGSIDANDVAK